MKIAIVAGAAGWRDVRGFDGQIYTLSTSLRRMAVEKIIPDIVFEIHRNRPEKVSDLIINSGAKKAVIAKPTPQLPKAEILPVKELTSRYTAKAYRSSVSWMVGYAGYMQAKELYFFGVDMKTRPEYRTQRDSLFYLIGRLEGEGVKIHIPVESKIYMPCDLYGV